MGSEAGVLDTLFFALFGTSLVLLIIGLITPLPFTYVLKHKMTRRKLGLIFGGLTIIFFILLGSTLDNSIKTESKPQQTSEVTRPFVFDVPSLVDKDIDKAKIILGSPLDKEPTEKQMSKTDKWSLTFGKDDKELLVTYNTDTGKIIDFFIGTDDPSGKTKDKNHLLELGNLKESDSHYKIEFVKAVNDSSFFTGVKVIPNS